MSRRFLQKLSPLCVVLAVLQLLAPLRSVQAADPPFRVARFFSWAAEDVGKKPKTGEDSAIECLAKNIDWLEHQINLFGTVVAKTPDVWGEARMTAHRQEFEDVLKQELRLFDKKQINAAEFVSDQSFLAFALAMQSKSPGATITPPAVTVNSAQSAGAATTATGVTSGIPSTTITTDFNSPTKLFGIDVANIKLGDTIRLEQTEMLDQLARYVNHLHELRRINEGDDASDAPGYSMNLVRIPVSLLPGQHTKQGYGAEITVTAEPYHGPELLPMAFRDFVINDLIDQLSLPMTRFLNAEPSETKRLMDGFEKYEEATELIDNINRDIRCGNCLLESSLFPVPSPWKGGKFFDASSCPKGMLLTEDNVAEMECEVVSILAAVEQTRTMLTEAKSARTMDKAVEPILKRFSNSKNTAFAQKHAQYALNGNWTHEDEDKKTEVIEDAIKQIDESRQGTNEKLANLKQVLASLNQIKGVLKTLKNISTVSLPASTTRRATLPFPPTQMISNYGLHELGYITNSAYKAFQVDLLNREVVHVTDLQAFLREEISAAYELMRDERMQHWWDEAANGQSEIVKMVRMRRIAELEQKRKNFIDNIGSHSDDMTTAALAWCVYVESLLLNERLVQDVRETFGNKPNTTSATDWLPYFGPEPPEEARQSFNEYVKVRWPIRVFALDPVVTEQNVADVRSIYRQMQMAIALSFAQGNVGTSAALQSMRKLQRDRATVDLNRTAVGFGHGDDTFGWRFKPRFQTPPVESNAKVLFRDLIVGGPTDKQLVRSEEIEPGMRECVAVVVMPSFVPHITFTTRGNWFKLGCPSSTAASMTETVQYSRTVKQMQTSALECVQCAHLYRDGEVDRLLKRVHQLDRRLPLQTLECQVPIENTLGGFEIFSTGTRELAPELSGWYGAPGYDSARGCRLFLSGDNFSVTQSRLIVGNQEIPFRLLSRQIMEVTLPAGLAAMRDRKLDEADRELYEGYVDAHVATPYGVSGHLLIPVVRASAAPKLSRAALRSNTLRITAKCSASADGMKPTTVDTLGSPASSVNLPRIEVPLDVGLNTKDTIGIRLMMTKDQDRLANVDIASLPKTIDGRGFEMIVSDLKKQLDSSDIDKLGGALKDHLNYLFSNESVTFKNVVSYRVKAAIKDSTSTAPIDGEFIIEVVIEKK